MNNTRKYNIMLIWISAYPYCVQLDGIYSNSLGSIIWYLTRPQLVLIIVTEIENPSEFIDPDH